MRFAGKKVLVTGAASGIGRATAIKLAEEGAQLIIADVAEEALNETAKLIGGSVRTHVYDAMDLESCKSLVAAAANDGLDVVCNIGGVLDWGQTNSFDEDRFERVMKINLTSVYAICRAALPHLVKTKGNIVNMSSTAGLTGIAYTVAYSASKHGIVAITKSLAMEFAAHEVRINAVAPSQVNTNMGHSAPPPEKDVDWQLVMRASPKLASGAAEPEDIANAVAFLASDDARKATGTILQIDCGQLAG